METVEPVNQVFSGEERYVSVYRDNKFVQRSLCNLFTVHNSLYSVRYHGLLNGHTILDLEIPRADFPDFRINEPGWSHD